MAKRRDDDLTTVILSFDRVESNAADREIAVLLAEDGTAINVPHDLLPHGARPGDVLSITFRRDLKATRKVAEQTRAIQRALTKNDPGGDITL